MNLFQGATALLAALLDDPQNRRLLRLEFPRGGAPAGRLMLANALEADEGISRDFTYTVEVLSDDAGIPLKDVMGKMVTVSLVRDDGTLRYFNGYVFEFRFLRTDGGFAFYQMVLKPWLAYLRLKHDSRIFQRLTLGEIIEQIFRNYLQRDYRYLMVNDLPVEIMLVQHRESDHNHLHRRLEAAGLHYWYEHRRDGHTFCLSDDSTLAEALEGDSDIEYQSAAGAQEDDGIQSWSAMRRIGAAQVTLGSYDFKNANSSWGERSSRLQQGAVPEHEMYDDTGAFGFSDGDGDALAKRRMHEIDARTQDFAAGSNARNIHPRRTMRLAGHFSGGRRRVASHEDLPEDKAQRHYLVLTVRHSVTNNYQDGRAAESHYRNEFTCIRRDMPWLPGRGYHSSDTRVAGVQTATVVGPKGEEIYTDEYGRIKLQFHWDREGKSDAGSSAFVRVMSGWAGSRFGAVSIPRIGQEVVVAFLDGNPDRPLVIGGVYNATHMPPWKLADDKRQSGIKSRELKGSRGNELRLDDTNGQISAHLSSDHGRSELNLGYLNASMPGPHGEPRGAGAELRSDLAAAIRGAQGVLITAAAADEAQGKQLDRSELVRIADGLQKVAEQLATLAEKHAGDKSPGSELKNLVDKLKDLEEKPSPIVAVSAPAGLLVGSAQNIAIAAATKVHILSAEDTELAAGGSTSVRAATGMSLFANQGAMKVTAAAGAMSLQAQDGQMDLLAQKVLDIISNTDWINLKAKQGVRINGGGTEIELSASGIMGYTSGKNAMYASDHQTFPAQNKPLKFPGDKPPPHEVCIPCLLIAAEAHSPFAPTR